MAKKKAKPGRPTPPKPISGKTSEKGSANKGQRSRQDVIKNGSATAHVQEEEVDPEQARLQSLVDNLQDKTEKEIVRTIKAIEYDRRQADSYTRLEIDTKLREKILSLAIETEAELSPLPKSRSKALDEPEEKILPRVAVTYGVLRRLGFSEDRVEECLKAITGIDLEEAFDWLYLHCTEEELAPGQSDSNDSRGTPSQMSTSGVSTSTPTTPLEASQGLPTESTIPGPVATSILPGAEAHVLPPVPAPEVTKAAQKSADPVERSNGEDAIKKRILAQYGNNDDSSESDDASEDDEDEDPNVRWARTRIRILQETQKGADADAALIARLKARVQEVESDYLFRRKDADKEYKFREVEMRDAALVARLRNLAMKHQAPPSSGSTSDLNPGKASSKALVSDDSDSDNEGGMLSGIVDEGPVEEFTPSGKVIVVHDMTMPRHWAGHTPRKLLQEIVQKIDRYATVSYSLISGGSRAVRARATVRFTRARQQDYDMIDVACKDQHQAEQYVATVALHAMTFLAQSGFASGGTGNTQTYFRLLPPAFIDLWSELELRRKETEDAGNRRVWGKLEQLVKLKLEAQPSAAPKAKKTDTPVVVKPSAARRSRATNPSEHLAQDFHARQTSPAYQEMLVHRDGLPIASYRQHIVEALEHSQFIVLSGETGCGKSTQLPAFILEDHLSRGLPCKILCTEPRRISAITLAQRVSRELGDAPGAVGTMASLVGYAIRLESNTSKNTRLTYCTNGIALRMLEEGSGSDGDGTAIDDITHIIIDEVHERSIESDFLLVILKSLIEQRPDLKVVLMSATLDAGKISAYFGNCPTLQVPGRTFPVHVSYLEDAVEYVGWTNSDASAYSISSNRKGRRATEWNEDTIATVDDDDNPAETAPTKLGKQYSTATVTVMKALDQRLIPYDLIIRLLEQLCFEDPNYQAYSAAVLVFMPGMNEIRRLHDALSEHRLFGGDGFCIYPLHSTISSENQAAAFDIPPPGVRKIVIATNIAETGVTIPDVTCVIDSGKHRETRFDEKRQISRLEETFIARSNAAQRRGRAGRVQEGLCFHLFTKHRHDKLMAAHPEPEMMRLSLSDLALRIKILKVKLGSSIEDVLSKALDPPATINVQRAVSALVEVKALTASEEITPMGRLLSKLPTDVHLGKFLLIAVVVKCLDPALTIAATLNAKSPFLNPFGEEDEAERARAKFKLDNSDFLTVHNAFHSWRTLVQKGESGWKFCRQNYLSHQNLQQIEDIRQQLLAYLADSSFIQTDAQFQKELSRARYTRRKTLFVTVPPELNINADINAVINAALGAGLYPKILTITPKSGELRTLSNNQVVSFHPSSVNFGARRRPQDLGTTYLTFFTIMHSTKLFAWETGPVDDLTLLLLCGDIEFKLICESGVIDRKLKYRFAPKSTVALKHLRKHITNVLSLRIRGRPLSQLQERWFEMGLECWGGFVTR